MNTIAQLLAISSLFFGCAGTQLLNRPVPDLRGHVVVAGPAVAPIVTGPADIHAYSAFPGGAIYTAPIIKGDGGDCSSSRAEMVALGADHVHAIRIEPGKVACLATATKGRFELLWHGHRIDAAPLAIAAANVR